MVRKLEWILFKWLSLQPGSEVLKRTNETCGFVKDAELP